MIDKPGNSFVRPRGRPHWPFWAPLAAILDFAGVTGGERVPSSPLGWYYIKEKLTGSKLMPKFI